MATNQLMVRGNPWTPPDAMPKVWVESWKHAYGLMWDQYKITPAQYRDMYIAQHGCCYICRTAKGINPDDPNGRGSKRLGVDHNHLTGKVRGLLCTGSTSANTCNRLIARYSVTQLKRAVEYLETEPGQTVLAYGDALERVAAPAWTDRDALMRGILGLI